MKILEKKRKKQHRLPVAAMAANIPSSFSRSLTYIYLSIVPDDDAMVFFRM
jgi:hypothetical protein